ncbi:MAG: hypothetical protein GX045_01985 [Clostridiaceae bacterium]|nr:hypothetical protein [Clostridiaceae bacterium]
MTTDFANQQKFKNALNKRTIALSYTGSDGDLELLKACLPFAMSRYTSVAAELQKK